MLLVARRRIPTAKKAPGKFAVTSAPPRAIWMAATLFRLAGPTAERVVESVCIHDQAPAGFDEMNALRSGLSALSTWWGSSKRKPR